jgi:hypothetical protein
MPGPDFLHRHQKQPVAMTGTVVPVGPWAPAHRGPVGPRLDAVARRFDSIHTTPPSLA